MITPDTASARRFGITFSARRESEGRISRRDGFLAVQRCDGGKPSFVVARSTDTNGLSRGVASLQQKSWREIRNRLNWLPRHGNRCVRMHAANPVRDLVKHIKSQFCWETPSAGPGASERQCTIQ